MEQFKYFPASSTLMAISKEKTHKDPSLIALLKDIDQKYDQFKYKTYRCAAKLLELKRFFGTIHIPFYIVNSVFQQHQLHFYDGTPVIKPDTVTAVVHDIFFAAGKLGYCDANPIDFTVDRATNNFINFIWHIFDCYSDGQVSIMQLKQTFLLLCETGTIENLAREHFYLWTDHNYSITRYRFQSMNQIFQIVFAAIDNGFNSNNNDISTDIISECFAECPGIGGLNEYQFTELWQKTTTKFSSLIDILKVIKRLENSETISTNTQCCACAQLPIHGLRFICQQCPKIMLCFKCFCNGYTNAKHNPTHRMLELSTKEIVENKFRAFIKKLCNIFSVNEKQQIGIVYETNCTQVEPSANCANNDEITKNESVFETIRNTPNDAASIDILVGIVESLTCEKDKLHSIIMSNTSKINVPKLPDSVYDFLNDHYKTLTDTIRQIQYLWISLSKKPQNSTSTPCRPSSLVNQLFASVLSNSVRGTDINKTYLENNRTDLSLNDLSTWIHTLKLHQPRETHVDSLVTVCEQSSSMSIIENELDQFKELLQVVKNIIEDSQSDNVELSNATGQLETILNTIINDEEKKRMEVC